MTLVVDYPWSHPAPSDLQAAGVVGAMRYLSTDPSKNLTRAEADALAARGIWCGVVWETTAGRALAGYAAGVADARAAAGQATACGMPASRPIYFAVDTDTNWASVAPYFQGVASVLGAARTGVYGGLHVIQGAAGSGLTNWYWQTSAWSGGVWDDRAHLRQGGSLTIGGVDCDRNTAMQPDYGQWMPGITPQEDIVTPQDIDAIAQAVWQHTETNAETGQPVYMGAVMAWMDKVHNSETDRILTQLAATQAAITALATQLGAQHNTVDTAAVVTAVQQAIEAAVVNVHVDVASTPAPAAH